MTYDTYLMQYSLAVGGRYRLERPRMIAVGLCMFVVAPAVAIEMVRVLGWFV